MKRFVCKKLLAVGLSVLMLVGMPAVAANVSAAPAAYTDIGEGDTLTVTLTVGQPTKYLRFVPEADGAYRFYSTGFMDTYGVLTDADDNVLYSNDDDGDELNFDMTCHLYAGNVYYLSVSIYGNGTGICYVTAEKASGGGAEADAVLTLGEGIQVTDVPAEEPVYFSFTPDWDGFYRFYTIGSADTYGELSDSDGNLLLFNDNTVGEENFSITDYLLGGQTYYLTVVGYGDSAVDYDLYVENPSDDALFANPSILYAGETWNCTTAANGDYLYFHFVPEVSGEYTFYSDGETDPYCFFYDTYENAVYYEDDSDVGVHFAFTYSYEAGRSYYFVVGNWDTAATFSIALEASDAEPETVEIAAGETVTVTAAEQDFRFVPQQDGWYCLTSSGAYDTSVEFYGYSTLLNDNDGEGKNFRLIVYGYAGEEYAFYTYNQEGEGTYSVSVSAVSERDLFPGAAAIGVGDTSEVYVDALNDGACYRFVPAADGTYTFYTTGDADSYCYLYDLNDDWITVWDDYYYYDDYNVVATYDFVAGETYYLLCSAYLYGADEAQFAVHLQSGGFDAPRAPQIYVDETQTVYPEEDYISQYYAFVPDEDGWYRFDFGVDGFLACELRDAEGYLLEETNNDSDTGDFSLVYFCEADTVYYIGLSAYAEDISLCTVTVTAADGYQLFPDAVTLASGQTDEVGADEKVYYRFIPTVSGVYTFASSGTADPLCALYNVATGAVTYYDDADYEAGDYNFALTAYFRAGQIYYFCVSSYVTDGERVPFEVTLSPRSDIAVTHRVGIDGLRAPEVGETVGDYYDVLGSVVTLPVMSVEDVAVLKDDTFVDMSETFVAGETYTMGIAFYGTDDTLFAEDCTVVVNAGTVSGMEAYEGYLVVYVDFTIPSEEPDVLYGDVDGNGKVNNKDLGRLQQYLNGWDVTVDADAGDLDGNGKVNNKDLGRLQQYLNGWDVELG